MTVFAQKKKKLEKLNYSRRSRKGLPRKFRKVVATRAGRLRDGALVSDHVA